MKIVNPTARFGEDAATSYLQRHGYKILERNFRKGYGEIDIVCLDPTEKILVFVEVKTRTSNQFGTALEAITPWKLRTLIKTAEFYKYTHNRLPEALRMDAIAVMMSGAEVEDLEHTENISGF